MTFMEEMEVQMQEMWNKEKESVPKRFFPIDQLPQQQYEELEEE